VKILEPELDKLIQWDAALMDDAVSMKDETAELVKLIDSGDAKLKAPLRDLEITIDKLISDYNERETVMRGFKE
jgi:CHASE3 domain sensor protein